MPAILSLAIKKPTLPVILFIQLGCVDVGFVGWSEGCNKYPVAHAHINMMMMYGCTHMLPIYVEKLAGYTPVITALAKKRCTGNMA